MDVAFYQTLITGLLAEGIHCLQEMNSFQWMK